MTSHLGEGIIRHVGLASLYHGQVGYETCCLFSNSRPKSGKLRLNKPTWAPVLEGKSIGLAQKTMLKRELLIWRTKNQAMDQGTVVQFKDSICFKSVQIGS
jgi:hypothetical protein